MKRAIIALLCVCALGITVEYARSVPSPRPGRVPIANEHLERVIAHMDRGPQSLEYRESIEYLREHSSQAVADLSGFLMEGEGSFRKWQLAYLIGEFGAGDAVETLGRWVAHPLPDPGPADPRQHRVDLPHSEEHAARIQAVSSIARIASHRPDLRDQVVEELVSIALESASLQRIALFELRALLGPDFDSLRDRFPLDERLRFEPYVPPPQWQALLERRTEEHRRQRAERGENQERVCRAR